MSLLSAVRTDASRDVLRSLRSICDEQGLDELAARLADLGDEGAAQQLAALDGKGGARPADVRLADARRLEGDGKLPEAMAAYQAIAEAGDARGLTRLAWLHEAGRGVPRNLDEAARLFRKAAEAGEAEGQYALSVMLDTGAGQQKNPDEALRWLRASAGSGYQPAVEALKAR